MIQQWTRVFIKTLKQHDKLPSVWGYLKWKTIQWGEAIKSIFSSNDKELVTNWAKEWRRTKNYKNLDENGFSKGNFPFKHIEKPYKNMHEYAVDRVDWTYLLPSWNKKYLATIQMLTNPETSWDRVTCTPKDYTKNIYPNNVWNQSNNPCNISPSKSDIWYAGFKKLPDWQTHASYKNKIAGLASAMRLLRKRKTYHNHSICFINCIWWYQGWHYKEHEVDWLKALRLIWITHVANHLKVSPTTPLNLDDPETLMAVIQAIALQETSSKIWKSTLEEAYKVAFPDEK